MTAHFVLLAFGMVLLFLFEAVGVLAGERFDERGLAVIYMTGGADDGVGDVGGHFGADVTPREIGVQSVTGGSFLFLCHPDRSLRSGGTPDSGDASVAPS